MDIASQRYHYNLTIWESISNDLTRNIEKGLCANTHIYTMVDALTRKELPNSADLREAGKKKSTNFIAAVATICPTLQNELFH